MVECEECGRTFFTRWGFNRHVRRHHPETTLDDWEYGVNNSDYLSHNPPPVQARLRRDRAGRG